MEMLTQHELDVLLAARNGPCVSVYMPTHRTVALLRENQIRLRGLLDAAARRLRDTDVDTASLLAPARDLLHRGLFAGQESDGLALFLAPGFFRAHRLPCPFEERVDVAPFFHVSQLLPLLHDDARYFVLAVSRNHVRLLDCTRDASAEVRLPDVPSDLATALSTDDPERSVQYHASSAPSSRFSPTYHGQGSSKDVEQDRLLRWFQRIERGVTKVVASTGAPLVLAAVKSHAPVYRQVNSYRRLLAAHVPGNPDRRSEGELRRDAWQIVAPVERERVTRQLAFLHQEADRGRATSRVDEVVVAAHDGRVRTLFVRERGALWGRVDENGGTHVAIHAAPEPGDVELVELAVVDTLRHGGAAYALPEAELPSRSPAAALLRY